MANFLNRYIMRHLFPVFLLIVVGLLIAPFLKAQSHADKILKDEITSDLKENILSFGKIQCRPFRRFLRFIGT